MNVIRAHIWNLSCLLIQSKNGSHGSKFLRDFFSWLGEKVENYLHSHETVYEIVLQRLLPPTVMTDFCLLTPRIKKYRQIRKHH